MCFYNDDCDWSAEVCNESEAESGPATQCDECYLPIGESEWRLSIHMQEHEECRACEWEEPEEDDEPCEKHDYGETFDYVRCRGCDNFLKAIEAREAEEGCPPGARRPTLCGLSDELYEHSDALLYARRAVEMFPELATHKIVARIIERFEDGDEE